MTLDTAVASDGQHGDNDYNFAVDWAAAALDPLTQSRDDESVSANAGMRHLSCNDAYLNIPKTFEEEVARYKSVSSQTKHNKDSNRRPSASGALLGCTPKKQNKSATGSSTDASTSRDNTAVLNAAAWAALALSNKK